MDLSFEGTNNLETVHRNGKILTLVLSALMKIQSTKQEFRKRRN